MRRPRITIAEIMAVVAVIAFGCFAWTMTGGAGILLIGPALTWGFVRLWRERANRFWVGFEVAGLAALLAYIGCFQEAGGQLAIFPGAIILLNLLRWGPANNPFIAAVVIFELSYGLPMLLIAWIGGTLATLLPGEVDPIV